MSGSARVGLGFAALALASVIVWAVASMGSEPEREVAVEAQRPQGPPAEDEGARRDDPAETPAGRRGASPSAPDKASRGRAAGGDAGAREGVASAGEEGGEGGAARPAGEVDAAAAGARADAGGERAEAPAEPELGPLDTAVRNVALPSVMMCLQERVKRGDSFDGQVMLSTAVKAAADDPKHAEVELRSIDSKDMSEADMECLWASFEDQLVPLDSDALREALSEGARDVNISLTLQLKGAIKPKGEGE